MHGALLREPSIFENGIYSLTAFNTYSTGTVSIGAGATSIVGSGTNWTGVNAKPGDDIVVAGHTVIVLDVVDATTITIDAWPYTAVSAGTAYKIVWRSPLRYVGGSAMASVNAMIAALDTTGFFFFVGSSASAPDPSYGSDGQYALQPNTGKLWVKSSGVWTYLGIYKGFNFTGAYNGATTYSVGDVMTDSGSSYVWINPTPGSGHTAPNTTYWQLIASIGATGATGATGAGYGGTSTTSITIGTGAKAFTTQAGLAYTNGARVRATATAGATGWVEGVVTYSGTTLTITSDKTSGSGTGTAWNLNVAGEPGAGDLSSANNLSDLANKSTARANLGVPQVYGQCRLIKSGSNIVLMPYNGNLLTVNGIPCTVPDAGVSLAATGLTAGTVYMIYATASAGVINALEASTTAHGTSTTAGNKGNEVKSGDDTRTLVGIASPNTGPVWADNLVLSWFNRTKKSFSSHNTATRSTTSTTFVELHSEMRVEFLTWSDEIVDAVLAGSGYPGAPSHAVFAAIGFDGNTPEDGMAAISDGTSGALRPVAAAASRTLTEGRHYATVLGASDSSSASFNLFFFSAANGFRSALITSVKG
ncbi:hypothetical protein QA649_34455 [Bradyrhizobium sp. CB1717]|uniref:hypothetical protein n=1 Tax=Bradyrhizobium sp. CB1717 TaxID=3039154 RepID=UPI0024B11CF6|nr:hypothetical protein [Bradyrhizobium sp. CB1717]WFU23145.1 hypothetical protein QA649_34455 [Bradyrhizobium sp. CB1717]